MRRSRFISFLRRRIGRATPFFEWLSWIAVALTVVLTIAHIHA